MWLPRKPAPPVTTTRNSEPLLHPDVDVQGTVDEIVEEKVDKTGGHPYAGALGSFERAELPPRSERGGGSLSIAERMF
jgi:hypothetical protein